MSDVLNLKAKSKKMNVTLINLPEGKSLKTENDETYFTRELEKQYIKGFNEAEKLTGEILGKEYSEKLKNKFEDIDKIKNLLDKIIPEYEQFFDKAVINLSILIAEKIVQREILRDTIISEVLRDAIKKVIGANKVIVKLNPVDFKTLELTGNESFSIESFDRIKFEQDVRIEPGGCFIETEIGSVDARISSQFNEIHKHLELNL